MDQGGTLNTTEIKRLEAILAKTRNRILRVAGAFTNTQVKINAAPIVAAAAISLVSNNYTPQGAGRVLVLGGFSGTTDGAGTTGIISLLRNAVPLPPTAAIGEAAAAVRAVNSTVAWIDTNPAPGVASTYTISGAMTAGNVGAATGGLWLVLIGLP